MRMIRIKQYLSKDKRGFDSITADIIFSNDKKVIAVTSCNDGEGKSTISLGLAHSLALEGYKVLLLDTAFESPSNFFRITECNTAFKDSPICNCELSDVVYTTDVNNLYIIPQTVLTADSQYFNTNDFSKLIRKLSEEFDYTIVDTSSVFKTADTVKISNLCDATILVVRYKKTKKNDVTAVARQFERLGKPIMGCVINRVKFDSFISRKEYGFLYTPPLKKLFGRQR